MAIKVGITGGIGSGKSTICSVFKILGVPVFEADKEARLLINTHESIRADLIHLYGKDIYTPEGPINRNKLASIIFNDDLQLEKVNGIVHPHVRDSFFQWEKEKQEPYVIHEAAILFESGFHEFMDISILVTAPESERISRISNRDGISENEIRQRMAKQWSDEKKREIADLELKNDNKHLLIPEIIKTDKQIRAHGKIW